jgi:hypothetical protein
MTRTLSPCGALIAALWGKLAGTLESAVRGKESILSMFEANELRVFFKCELAAFV